MISRLGIAFKHTYLSHHICLCQNCHHESYRLRNFSYRLLGSFYYLSIHYKLYLSTATAAAASSDNPVDSVMVGDFLVYSSVYLFSKTMKFDSVPDFNR